MSNEKDQGYVRIPRKLLLDKELVKQDVLFRVLMYLYGWAQHKERVVFNGRNMPAKVLPGQAKVPLRDIASDLNLNYGSVNRAVLVLRQIGYVIIHKSQAGNIIELIHWVSGSQNGSDSSMIHDARNNTVLPSEVNKTSEGEPQMGDLNDPEAVTVKWLAGLCLNTGKDHDDLDYREEIEAARVQAAEDGRNFTRGYMWRKWQWRVDDCRARSKNKKKTGGGGGSNSTDLVFHEGRLMTVREFEDNYE